MNAFSLIRGNTDHREWLVANNLGDFAMGTVSRMPTRKYHGLLTLRDGSPDPLHVLADVTEILHVGGEHFDLTSFQFEGGTQARGCQYLTRFSPEVEPVWQYACGQRRILRRLQLLPDHHVVRITWEVSGAQDGDELLLYPHFTLRGIHENARENAFLLGNSHPEAGVHVFQFYQGMPEIGVRAPGVFEPSGFWNRRVHYSEEQQRGYEPQEDLFCPGCWRVPLKPGELISIDVGLASDLRGPQEATVPVEASAQQDFAARLERAAGTFMYENEARQPGVIAGFPWFGEWARDTLLSLDGLLLARNQPNHATAILERYAQTRVDGLLPNIMGHDAATSAGVAPDASLLFTHALQQTSAALSPAAVERWLPVAFDMLEALRTQRAHGVGIAPSGLLAADRRPEALTWMDVRLEGRPVTPRAPYAVELNALYYNALCFALEAAKEQENHPFLEKFVPLAEKFPAAFNAMFWSDELGYFADAHDGHHPDFSLRPNQLFAFSLPFKAASDAQAKSALEKVRAKLVTPVGLRTLSPDAPDYRGRCTGSAHERDLAYHQGTVWPWLLMPYLDAVAYLDGKATAAEEARGFMDRFAGHLDEACIGQVSEIFDGEAPHTPRGAPAQAWSVAALLSISRHLRAAPQEPAATKRGKSRLVAKKTATKTRSPRKTGAKALQE